jgi:hypothetical protein
MDVRGMIGLVQMQLKMGIYHFYSGVAPMDVHGMQTLVQQQLKMGIS